MEEWKVTDEIPMVGGGCHPLDLLRWYVGDAVCCKGVQEKQYLEDSGSLE